MFFLLKKKTYHYRLFIYYVNIYSNTNYQNLIITDLECSFMKGYSRVIL